MLIDQWDERKCAAEICLMRKILRPGAYWSLIFGVIALLGGFTGLQYSVANIGLIFLGLFMVIEGIWILKAPSPAMILAECVLFIMLAAWNLGIVVLEGNSAGPWPVIAAIQTIVALKFYKKYKRFAHLTDLELPKALCDEFVTLIRRVLRGKPGKQEDIVLLTTFTGRWKIGLFGNEAMMLDEKGEDLCFARRDDVRLTDEGNVKLSKDRKIAMEVEGRKWNGRMNHQQYERFEQWRSSIAQPVHSTF